MPSPFPGMDPYLEHPALWPDVHQRLIVALADALGPPLRPRYRVAVDERVYVRSSSAGPTCLSSALVRRTAQRRVRPSLSSSPVL